MIDFKTFFMKISLHFTLHELLAINKLFLKREKEVILSH